MLFLLRKLNVLLRVLFKSPIQALQKSDENSLLGSAGKPGTHSRRRTAPVNPDAFIRAVSSPMRPPPAPALTDANIGTLLPSAFEILGSWTGSDISSSSLVLDLMEIKMETGSSPKRSASFCTRV